MFAVVDVETTGGPPSRDRITEIAVYRFDGARIVDEYSSLVNPRRKIDPFVIKLTGITNEMVADAPTFDEVADRVEEVTRDAIFVAHNVGFDYRMVRKEFGVAGRDFKRKQLCTVQLAQKMLKDQPSYSLGKLTKNLGIGLEGRHRAYGDAKATVKLLHLLLDREGFEPVVGMVNGHLPEDMIPQALSHEDIDDLPEAPAVVTFRDEHGHALYIKAWKNAYNDMVRFLRNNAENHRYQGLFQGTDHLECEPFSSIVVSELDAYRRIRTHRPPFNKNRYKKPFSFGIFPDADTVLRVAPLGDDDDDEAIFRFGSQRAAERHLKKMRTRYDLHPALGEEVCAAHLERMLSAEFFEEADFFIVRPDMMEPESWIIQFCDHRYRGYARVANDELDRLPPDEWTDLIRPDECNVLNTRLLQKYLRKKKGVRTVAYGRSALKSS